jgi:hypothetical protein
MKKKRKERKTEKRKKRKDNAKPKKCRLFGKIKAMREIYSFLR